MYGKKASFLRLVLAFAAALTLLSGIGLGLYRFGPRWLTRWIGKIERQKPAPSPPSSSSSEESLSFQNPSKKKKKHQSRDKYHIENVPEGKKLFKRDDSSTITTSFDDSDDYSKRHGKRHDKQHGKRTSSRRNQKTLRNKKKSSKRHRREKSLTDSSSDNVWTAVRKDVQERGEQFKTAIKKISKKSTKSSKKQKSKRKAIREKNKNKDKKKTTSVTLNLGTYRNEKAKKIETVMAMFHHSIKALVAEYGSRIAKEYFSNIHDFWSDLATDHQVFVSKLKRSLDDLTDDKESLENKLFEQKEHYENLLRTKEEQTTLLKELVISLKPAPTIISENEQKDHPIIENNNNNNPPKPSSKQKGHK